MSMLGLDSEGGSTGSQYDATADQVETSMWSFDGRIGRRNFWVRIVTMNVWGIIAGLLIGLIAGAIASSRRGAEDLSMVLSIPLYIACVWFGLATQVKRWHDLNHSGWMVLINFTIIAIPFTFIYTGFFKGTSGPNRFGANPV